MARSRKKQEGRRSKRLAIPWALLQGTIVIGRRWQRLSGKERERLSAMLRDSRGRVDRLSAKERVRVTLHSLLQFVRGQWRHG